MEVASATSATRPVKVTACRRLKPCGYPQRAAACFSNFQALEHCSAVRCDGPGADLSQDALGQSLLAPTCLFRWIAAHLLAAGGLVWLTPPGKMSSPELTIAALSAEKLQILRGPPKFGEEIFSAGGGNIFDYNPTGSCFVHCRDQHISFYTSIDSDPVKNKAQAEVKRLSFSPTGAYSSPGCPCWSRTDNARSALRAA